MADALSAGRRAMARLSLANNPTMAEVAGKLRPSRITRAATKVEARNPCPKYGIAPAITRTGAILRSKKTQAVTCASQLMLSAPAFAYLRAK